MAKSHIKKDDLVVVTTGHESIRGKSGKVLKVLVKKNMVIVQGLRMIKKTQKATQTTKGGIFDREGPIHISNVKKADGILVAAKPAKKVPAKKSTAVKKAKTTDES